MWNQSHFLSPILLLWLVSPTSKYLNSLQVDLKNTATAKIQYSITENIPIAYMFKP